MSPRPKSMTAAVAKAAADSDRSKIFAALDAVPQHEAVETTSERDRLNALLLEERDHQRNCVGWNSDTPRVEMFAQRIPDTAERQEWGGPGDTCTTVRCLICAGYTLLPGTPEENLRRLQAKLENGGDAAKPDESEELDTTIKD